MLIALLTVLLLGGGGGLEVFSKEQRKLVQEIVVDGERAAAVVAEMKGSQKSFDRTAGQIGTLVKTWRKIDADRGSVRADLQPVIQEGDDVRADSQRVFVDAVFEMRGQMTAEEWAEVFPGSQ